MISIIILTFDSIKFIKPCLDSILVQDYHKFEIIIVDNGSNDGTTSFIKVNYPQAILIENKQNLGTCRARNQGIEMARGSWVLTLDCDVVLENNFFSELLKIIKDIPANVGMIQPKILKADRRTIYSCGIYLSLLRRFYDIGQEKEDSGQFDKPRNIFGACSAAAVYRRKMLEDIKEKTGYFNERFFFLVEDVDLSWRAQNKGWKTLFCPELVCFHLGNSSNTAKTERQYLCFRNRYIMIQDNETLLGKIKLFSLSFWYEIPRTIYLFFTNRYLWRSI